MASTVLPNGIIIPEKYSRDWYNDLYHNWQELDNLLGGGTPKDGTLTIQKNGTTVGTFSANQSTDETINITVPDVNDGTLTIQQNGTTVDSFSANSSTDKTVNITVPTKTSDLTNDSGFITSDTTKIPLAGSNQISGDLIPSTTDTVNLGSSSYQWNQAYIKSLTINGVACGDILTHNASEFVNVSSAQTIGGDKTFSNIIYCSGNQVILKRNDVERTVLPASIVYMSYSFNDKSAAGVASRFSAVENVVKTNGDINLILRAYDFSTKSNAKSSVVMERKYDGTSNFYPEVSNDVNLGTSTNKWKSFNGLNPGALSLPSTLLSAMIQIDTTSWVLDGETDVEYTPLGDGYLTLTNNQNLEWVKGQITNDNNFGIYRFTYKYDSVLGGVQGFTIPCIKGKKVIMKIKGTGFYNALFIYCQGNV